MAKKILDFTVDTIQSTYSPIGTVKQLDSVFFNIQITENGAVKNISNQTLKLFAKKNDSKIVEQRTDINIINASEGRVSIDLLNSALQCTGLVIFELEISDNTGTISTANFILKVQEKIANDKVIESTTEIFALKEIEDYVVQAKIEIQEFKALKDDMVETNNNINVQEDLRVQAENLRIEAELNREKSLKNLDELKTSYFGKEFSTPQERFLNEFEYLNNGEEKGSFLPFSASKNHKIQESIEGKTRGMCLEGETLQNLLPKSTITLNSSNSSKAFKILDIKANTSFFVSVNITEKKAPLNRLKCGFKDKNGVWNYHTLTTGVGFQSKKFELDYDITDITFYISSDEFVSTPDANITFIEPMCYISEKEILGYFEGIKSIGQEENKISILSHGKNLFNLDKFKELLKTSLVEDVENGVIVNNGVRDLTTMVKFENKNYRFIYKREKIEGNGMSLFRVLYSNGTEKYLNGNDVFNGNNITKFEITYNDNGKTKLTDIILSDENNQNYEPYKQDEKDILIPFAEGLKGIGSVKDEINSITNKATQRIDKYVFTGDEELSIPNWGIPSDTKNTIGAQIFFSFANENILCDRLPVYPFPNVTQRDFPHIMASKQYGVIAFKINKSELETQDLEGIRKWLKNNKLSFYYTLGNPVEYDLTNQDLNLNTYNGLTYISTEALSTFSAPVTISNTIARLNRENKTLEKENIELKKDTKLLASAMLNILEPMLLPNGEINNSNLELLKELNKIVEN